MCLFIIQQKFEGIENAILTIVIAEDSTTDKEITGSTRADLISKSLCFFTKFVYIIIGFRVTLAAGHAL